MSFIAHHTTTADSNTSNSHAEPKSQDVRSASLSEGETRSGESSATCLLERTLLLFFFILKKLHKMSIQNRLAERLFPLVLQVSLA